jgi:hypothetical protein
MATGAIAATMALDASGDLDAQRMTVPEGSAMADMARCDKYARHAVEQYRRSRVQGCALKPNGRWQDNAEAHYRWCLNADDAQRAGEQRARSDWLWACGAVGDRRENARCDAYAYRAVDHFRLTRKTGCGVRVDGRWNANYNAHYDWCVNAGDPALAGEENSRTAWLRRCGGFGYKELDDRCDQYARRAVKQYTMTGRKGCGVRADGRWNANYDTHYEWCLDAGEPARGSEQDARDDWLFRCGAQHMID